MQLIGVEAKIFLWAKDHGSSYTILQQLTDVRCMRLLYPWNVCFPLLDSSATPSDRACIPANCI